MTQNTLVDRIGCIFAEVLHLDVPAEDLDLFDSGVVDSLAFVELLLQLEREFGVTVSLDDLEVDNFRSIRRIAEFVEPRIVDQPLRLVRR
jgi:D-alanine--poly(phosphoribitol) ligase subunit 2